MYLGKLHYPYITTSGDYFISLSLFAISMGFLNIMFRYSSLYFGLLQLASLCGLLWLCNLFVSYMSWPVPGSVLGLGVLVVLLVTKIVPERAVQVSSSWLLGELLLFFIPPVISVLKYQVLIRDDGWMIAGTIVFGTVGVLLGTALVVDRVYSFEKRLNERRLEKAVNYV